LDLEIIHINQLLKNAVDEDLYLSLIQQLNKDFILSNLEKNISESSTPTELKSELYAVIEELINSSFDTFLSLLYRVDLSENEIKHLPKENFETYIATVSFLILKREWQKVWFRKEYSS
jgi:hypothetical protein